MGRPTRTRKTAAPAPIKLDLACGQRKQPGHVGVDLVAALGVDVVHDLRRTPWPFADASVEAAYCAHFLEHLTGTERLRFMDELYRVLLPGAAATIITPYYTSMRAVQDPTHQWPPISEASYLYFNKEWRVANKLDHYPIACDFDFTYGMAFAPDWAVRAQEARDFALRHYMNVVADLHVTMTKR